MTYDEGVEVVEYLLLRGLHFYCWGPTWNWLKVEAHYCALVDKDTSWRGDLE